MQMLLYFAQLGMFAHMNGNSNVGVAGVPPSGVSNMPNMMFPMMAPQMAACAAQQQWQAAGMAPSTIANIAAAAAVAATAATSHDVSSNSTIEAHRIVFLTSISFRVSCWQKNLALQHVRCHVNIKRQQS